MTLSCAEYAAHCPRRHQDHTRMGSTQTAVRPRSTGFTPLPPSPPPPPPEVSKAAEHLEGERIQIIGKASVAAGQVDFFPSAWFSKMGVHRVYSAGRSAEMQRVLQYADCTKQRTKPPATLCKLVAARKSGRRHLNALQMLILWFSSCDLSTATKIQ